METSYYHEIINTENDYLYRFTQARRRYYPGKDIVFRKIKVDDFDRDYTKVLRNLTQVGKVTKEMFEHRYNLLNLDKSHIYKIVVAVDTQTDKIVASGTVFFELKFVRNMGI